MASSWSGSSRPRTRSSRSHAATPPPTDGATRSSASTARVIVHLSETAPRHCSRWCTISDATAERFACGARITFIKPDGNDLVHTRGRRGANDAQLRFLFKRSKHCQYPGCSTDHDLEAHHMTPWALGGKTSVEELTLECPRHHTLHPRSRNPRHRHRCRPDLRQRRRTPHHRPPTTRPTWVIERSGRVSDTSDGRALTASVQRYPRARDTVVAARPRGLREPGSGLLEQGLGPASPVPSASPGVAGPDSAF